MTAQPELEKAIRKHLEYSRDSMPTGKLTKEDFNKVMKLSLYKNQLTEVPKGLENLLQLTLLNLQGNPALTKAQIAELKKALPKCDIYRDFD